MKVLLIKDVFKLGRAGDVKRVADGYGRNFLVPQGKAVPATASNIADFEARRAELEAAAAATLAAAEARAELINALGLISIAANAGEEGKLFGSIGTRDIAEAITAAGCEVDKSEVRLPEGALRQLGEFEIAIQVHGDVFAAVAIAVIPE